MEFDSWKTLGECCDIIMGQSPKSETYNTEAKGLPFFQGKAEFGKLSPRVKKWCSRPIKIAKKGDVLISIRAPVGPTNLADVDCCIGRGLGALRPGKSVINKWILLYLRGIENDISALGTGTTFSAISGDTLRQVLVPIPPLAEQKRIAHKIEKMFTRLDKVSDCLNRIKQNITYARSACLEKYFSGIGVMKKLGDVAAITSGNPAPQNKKYFVGGKHFFVRVKDMGKLGNAIKITYTKDLINDEGVKGLKIFPKGSVLFTKSGASTLLNQRAILEKDMYVVSHIGIAMPKKIITSEWLYFFLKNKDFGKIAHSTVMPSLPLSKVCSIPIIVPPLAEQKRIAHKIEKMFRRLDKIELVIFQTQRNIKNCREKILNSFLNPKVE